MHLANHLTKDYDVQGNQLVYKHKVFLKKPDKSEFEIPVDWFWILKQLDKNDREKVASASKILKHDACFKLAEEWNLDLSKMKTSWLQLPTEANGERAVVEIFYPGCPPIIGEASPSSLNSNMRSYIVTMANKRGQDKVVTYATGIYLHGFYSQSETGGTFKDGEVEDKFEMPTPIKKAEKTVSVGGRKYELP